MLYVKRSSGGSGDGGFRNNGAGLDVHYYLLTTMLELLVVVHVIIMLSVHHCLLLSLLTSVCTDWRSGLLLVAG